MASAPPQLTRTSSEPPTLPPLALSPPSSPVLTSSPHTFPPRQDDVDYDGNEIGVAMGGDTVPPAATVRLSVLRRMWAATGELQGLRRARLAFFGIVGLAQVVAFTVICATSYHDQCDVPLGPYLVMVIVRIVCAFPPYFWLTISPPRPDRRNPDAVRAALAQSRHVGSLAVDYRVRRLADLISIYSVVVFVAGNWWVISSTSCPADSPTLYRGAVAALVFSWLYVAEILVWATLVIFFLPFLLIGVRWFGMGQKKNEVGPLKKEDVASLPQRVFLGIIPDEGPPPSAASASPALADPASPTPSPATPNPPPSPSPAPPAAPRRQFWRLWRRRAKSRPSDRAAGSGAQSSGSAGVADGERAPLPEGVEGLRLPESQAACAICLCEYEPPPLLSSPEAATWQPERLILLPCAHTFHTECLGDWLAVSGRCPLCQRDLHAPKKRGRQALRRGGGGGSDGDVREVASEIGAPTADERV
ncbi:uncharacterized protein RHOBADRAFT_55988 [Rhodotorula graminis WP1]|uniref:RING-type E3 ubiquitin transferase n=1 Tax=Rhodotorula graminis (strain WP1) TaxID=578459 RepID=A0A0P9GXJ8_RHOGW|nr:uncharacterized protein RHOBADRAFT_55988 [Rhodotorula graminis WP1]KPV72154.1 hypothetical protein RHOBADRAFT_55988 [Rhodotorula graminis WP1]